MADAKCMWEAVSKVVESLASPKRTEIFVLPDSHEPSW